MNFEFNLELNVLQLLIVRNIELEDFTHTRRGKKA